ncbi:MAG: STAS domain-containing protein [candidate division Zixibacteria bacterium]|nr:STAS domain-containing protein [candidate division Zixibacteria bacterium]MBU1471623.1 STAS domain-containing protein [candidate division Zixibacteria bacterium]MBU2625243.1 STAS domain-containing protein [candidate division Zixibacteria bacterium]
MENIKISLDTSGVDGEISIVRVDGVIDTMTATELEKVMNSLLGQKRFNIVIDLGGVDYISSAGWGIFISNIREIRQNDGDIKLARMIPNVHEIFELLEFDSILHCFDNIEKAKHDFRLNGNSADNDVEASKSTVAGRLREAGAAATAEAPAAVAVSKPVTIADKVDEHVAAQPSLESRVLELVKEDPFYSVSEMKKIINSENSFEGKVGWWKIRSILRENDLKSKKKRFRYSRKG